MLPPFEIYRDAIEAKTTARDAAAKTDETACQVEELARRVERLTLVAQALWELLRESGAHTEAQLLARIEAVDLRDGRRDGRISPSVRVCPRCQRNSSSRRLHCIYCDAPLPAPNVFEAR